MKKRSVLGAILLCVAAAPAFAADTAGAGSGMTPRMMTLVIQLGVILFAARLGNILFEKMKWPGVLGELTAGMLIGPFLLGGVSFLNFEHGLFPKTGDFPVSPELYGLCSVAAIVLLFSVGLETDMKLFLRYSWAGTFVAVGGVIVSFAFGDVLGMVFSRQMFGEQLGFMSPACLFLGIISTATSVGITARVLSDQRKVDSPEGVTILAGAVIDDVLGIICLAVGIGVMGASRNGGSIDWDHIGMVASKSIGIWLAATAIGILASHKISILLKWFGDRSAIAVMALGLALILAGFFEEAGLAMIIGAYVMGLSLSRTDISRVIRDGLRPIYAFLVPIFFVVMGMLVDLKMLGEPSILLFGVAYTVTAIAAKIIGCGVPALLCNFNLRGAARVGVGMVPRGEVALIVAGIGLASGLLDHRIFSTSVLMTLATTLLAPPLLVLLFRNPAGGQRKAVAAEKAEPLSFAFPSAGVAQVLVTKLLAIFELDGFFVHVLDERRKVCQLRKDDMVIGFEQRGAEIFFECDKKEVSVVNTAMYEVVAELEEIVKELRKPIAAGGMAGKMLEGSGQNGKSALLSSYIMREALEPNLTGTNKKDIIEELIRVLDSTGVIDNIKDAREAVWRREKSMSTGLQSGIAMPHGRTDSVKRLVCAIGLKPKGLDFQSLDGKPSTIFVLILSPGSRVAPHMQFMSAISQTLDEKGRHALLACKSRGEMYSVLTGGETT